MRWILVDSISFAWGTLPGDTLSNHAPFPETARSSNRSVEDLEDKLHIF
jgi:hypothetical protein